MAKPSKRQRRHVRALDAQPSATHLNKERAAFLRRRRQIVRLTWLFVLLVLLIAASLLVALLAPDPVPRLARCLADRGATVYCSDLLDICQEQKRVFGFAFAEIPYVNCDFSDACASVGNETWPLWTIGDRRLEGVQSLSQLAAASGCPFDTIKGDSDG